MTIQSGVYETMWGNACSYHKGNNYAYDLDMCQKIPLTAIDFQRRIRDFDEGE